MSSYYTGDAAAVTIPVTLTLAPSTEPFFQDLSGGLQFSLASGGGNPGNQFLQVQNAGSGTLNWTVTATTADGGLACRFSRQRNISVCRNGRRHFKKSSRVAQPLASTTGDFAVFQREWNGVRADYGRCRRERIHSSQPAHLQHGLPGAHLPFPRHSLLPANRHSISLSLSFHLHRRIHLMVKCLALGSKDHPRGNGSDCGQQRRFTIAGRQLYGGSSSQFLYAGTAAPLSVPVTLNILPTTQPLFDKVPGPFSFRCKRKVPTPPVRSFKSEMRAPEPLTGR